MKIFSGSSNTLLTQHIAHELGIQVSPVEMFTFPDGERRIQIKDMVVGEDTVVVQSTSSPVDANYMELYFIIDGLKRSGAKSVTVIMPYVGYQRQDHVFREGEAVSLEVVIRVLESLKVDRVIVCDLHSIKIKERFHIPLTHLSGLSLFAEEIKKNGWENADSCLVSPDMGGLRRIEQMSRMLKGMPFIATVKNRDLSKGDIEMVGIQGDKKHIKKRALIVDDMASSGGTVIKSAKLLKDNGVEEIIAFITHPIFSENASMLLQDSIINRIYTTDSVFISQEKQFSKLTTLSLAHIIAEELR